MLASFSLSSEWIMNYIGSPVCLLRIVSEWTNCNFVNVCVCNMCAVRTHQRDNINGNTDDELQLYTYMLYTYKIYICWTLLSDRHVILLSVCWCTKNPCFLHQFSLARFFSYFFSLWYSFSVCYQRLCYFPLLLKLNLLSVLWLVVFISSSPSILIYELEFIYLFLSGKNTNKFIYNSACTLARYKRGFVQWSVDSLIDLWITCKRKKEKFIHKHFLNLSLSLDNT